MPPGSVRVLLAKRRVKSTDMAVVTVGIDSVDLADRPPGGSRVTWTRTSPMRALPAESTPSVGRVHACTTWTSPPETAIDWGAA